MTDTYTPTTADWEHWASYGIMELGPFDIDIPLFAEWLAAHDAEVAAKVLEEAADLAEGVECIVPDPVMEKIGKNVGLSLAQEFRARAAEIREGR